MKVYDISQELFSSKLYPGDSAPSRSMISDMSCGDMCNVTRLTLSTHHGTHLDAPRHFIENGKSIDQIPIEKFVGIAKVVSFEGQLKASDVVTLMADSPKKVLLKGELEITKDAAIAFNEQGLEFLGVESSSVAPFHDPKTVHIELLKHEVIVLEGIRLRHVKDGNYLLVATPLHLAGADGAPCRAILIEKEGPREE